MEVSCSQDGEGTIPYVVTDHYLIIDYVDEHEIPGVLDTGPTSIVVSTPPIVV